MFELLVLFHILIVEWYASSSLSMQEKGKVNQLDVGNKEDQHNNYKTRT